MLIPIPSEVADAWRSGRDPKVGSDEEMALLAAVALKETEAAVGMTSGSSGLDYAMRSHMLLAVLRTALMAGEDAEKEVGALKTKFPDGRRLEAEAAAESRIREGLRVMKPYVQKQHGVWPDTDEGRVEPFRQDTQGKCSQGTNFLPGPKVRF